MVTFVETWVWMHLNDIGLPQIIIPELRRVSLDNFFLLEEHATPWRVAAFRHWRRLLDLMFCTQLSIGRRIITRAMKLHDLFYFFSRFCRLCRSYCRSLSFMLFVLSFTAVHIAVFCRLCLYCRSLLFAVVHIAVFLSFTSFVMPFFAVHCHSYCRFLSFF